jgi:hypothetical protein
MRYLLALILSLCVASIGFGQVPTEVKKDGKAKVEAKKDVKKDGVKKDVASKGKHHGKKDVASKGKNAKKDVASKGKCHKHHGKIGKHHRHHGYSLKCHKHRHHRHHGLKCHKHRHHRCERSHRNRCEVTTSPGDKLNAPTREHGKRHRYGR